MTGGALVVAALLLVAAALVAWPVQSVRARRRRVLETGRGKAGADPDEALVEWIRELGRTPEGPVDGAGDSPTVGRPVGIAYQPQPSVRSTVLDWPARDATGRPSWPGELGGPAGPGGSVRSTGPAGPTRPPTRRDPRRPAGTARPEDTNSDAGRGGGTTVAAIAIDAADVVDVEGPAPSVERQDVAAGSRGALFSSRGVEASGDLEPGDQRTADTMISGPSVVARARTMRPTARVLPLAGLLGGGVGAVVGGPVAAVALASYGTLAVRAVLRWRTNRSTEQVRRRGLDQLCGLAADLRAGLPVPHALDVAADGPDRLRQLTSAAVRLADRTGAPLAELVERIEADARATDRGLAAAAAQAAGARATAWLLAALPVGGIGLGYGIGVDPVAVLLHSRVGGACAVLAVALQVVGLLWAERLSATPGRTG
ncbi:type II secretion system F family protein [Micromonospora chokoriensis]